MVSVGDLLSFSPGAVLPVSLGQKAIMDEMLSSPSSDDGSRLLSWLYSRRNAVKEFLGQCTWPRTLATDHERYRAIRMVRNNSTSLLWWAREGQLGQKVDSGWRRAYGQMARIVELRNSKCAILMWDYHQIKWGPITVIAEWALSDLWSKSKLFKMAVFSAQFSMEFHESSHVKQY